MKLKPENLDVYFALQNNFDYLKKSSVQFKGVLLDVGCGQMPFKEFILSSVLSVTQYISLDLPNNVYGISPDLTWDGITIPMPSESVDTIITTQFLEHHPEPNVVISEMHRVLRGDGFLFLTVPFLWPFHDVPSDQYRFTPFSLERMFRQAKFSNISIHPYGGWDASLATMLGLWVRRRNMSPFVRRLLSLLFLPVIKSLHKYDRPPIEFHESSMTQGLWVTCQK